MPHTAEEDTGSCKREAKVGGGLGQRDRQMPWETLKISKMGHRDTRGQSAKDQWGSGRNLGLGRRRVPVGALPPALRVTLGNFTDKMRRQGWPIIL